MSAVWQIFNIKLMQCSETEIVGKTYEITLSKLIFGTFWASWNHTVSVRGVYIGVASLWLAWFGLAGRVGSSSLYFALYAIVICERKGRVGYSVLLGVRAT